MRARAGVAAVVVLLAALTACDSGPGPTTGSSPAPSGSSSVPSSSAASEPPRSEPAPPTTSAPPTVEPTSSVPPAASDACSSASLSVTALPGSGSSGMQYETVQFTNSGSAACSLTGAPTVAARLAGADLGGPATTSSNPATTVPLAPGASATAVLSGPSTCDAPLSDTLRVTAPGTTGYVDVPAVVRGCPLTVDPVTGG